MQEYIIIYWFLTCLFPSFTNITKSLKSYRRFGFHDFKSVKNSKKSSSISSTCKSSRLVQVNCESGVLEKCVEFHKGHKSQERYITYEKKTQLNYRKLRVHINRQLYHLG